MRGLETILNQLQISLQTNASPLTDFAPQGVTYTLMRSIASGIQMAQAAIASGAARHKLDQFIAATQN